MPKLLSETSTTTLLREGAGFRAIMITPGKGSSGTYSEAVLRRDASIAFPPGTKAFIDHPTEANPGRSVRNMIGTYPDGGVYEEGVGIVSRLVPYPHMVEFVAAVAADAALSIYAMGESDSMGNVTALLADVQNSVDLVAYPGRPGSGLTPMYEAAIAASVERTAPPADEIKETKMTPEQEAKLDALAALVESFVAESKTDAAARAQESVDAKAALTAADARVEATFVALEAIKDANLPATLSEGLVSSVKAGNLEVAPLIASAVKLHEAVKAEYAAANPPVAPRGFVREESTDEAARAAEFDSLFGGKA